jgi:hypothetical protein
MIGKAGIGQEMRGESKRTVLADDSLVTAFFSILRPVKSPKRSRGRHIARSLGMVTWRKVVIVCIQCQCLQLPLLNVCVVRFPAAVIDALKYRKKMWTRLP